MQFFLDFLRQNRNLNRLVNRVSEYPGHQGTVLRFSDRFLFLYARLRTMPQRDSERLIRFYRDAMADGFPYPLPFLGGDVLVDTSKIGFSEIDDFKKRTGRNVDQSFFAPLEVIISVFNDADLALVEGILKEYSNDKDFRVQIEKRGRNSLLSARRSHNPLTGGISISPDNENYYGTLGGFLKDKAGNTFGLTCAHVVEGQNKPVYQPAIYDSRRKARAIGTVAATSTFNFSGVKTPCHPGTSSGSTDVALIRMDAGTSCEPEIYELGRVTRMAAFNELSQGMKVEFNGRTTNKRKQVVVGGICVSYKVAYRNRTEYACFTNLIELREVPFRCFGTGFSFQRPPVRAGDSGAWICSGDSQGYTWCGMLISGDVDRGYFLPATDIIKSLEDLGYQLSL